MLLLILISSLAVAGAPDLVPSKRVAEDAPATQIIVGPHGVSFSERGHRDGYPCAKPWEPCTPSMISRFVTGSRDQDLAVAVAPDAPLWRVGSVLEALGSGSEVRFLFAAVDSDGIAHRRKVVIAAVNTGSGRAIVGDADATWSDVAGKVLKRRGKAARLQFPAPPPQTQRLSDDWYRQLRAVCPAATTGKPLLAAPNVRPARSVLALLEIDADAVRQGNVVLACDAVLASASEGGSWAHAADMMRTPIAIRISPDADMACAAPVLKRLIDRAPPRQFGVWVASPQAPTLTVSGLPMTADLPAVPERAAYVASRQSSLDACPIPETRVKGCRGQEYNLRMYDSKRCDDAFRTTLVASLPAEPMVSSFSVQEGWGRAMPPQDLATMTPQGFVTWLSDHREDGVQLRSGPAPETQISEAARVMRDSAELHGFLGNLGLDGQLRGGVGGLIGSKGTLIGSGGLGSHGSGLSGGGNADGLGGLGTKGLGTQGLGYRGSTSGSVATLESFSVNGSIDKAVATRVLERHMNQIRYCYQREVVRDAKLAGKLSFKVTVNADGDVAAAKVVDGDPDSPSGMERVATCVRGRFMRMTFPAQEGTMAAAFRFSTASRAVRVAGPPIVIGAIDPALVQSGVNDSMSELERCGSDLKGGGKLTIKFVVAKDGSVAQASVTSSTLEPGSTATCAVGVHRNMQFSAPKGGGIAIIKTTYVFTTAIK
ncbi:MAG: AgmX/PglI C-terminal domain-containing protein [Myxococcota bacterium]